MLIAAVLILSGCKVGPDYVPPETALEAQWQNAAGDQPADPNVLQRWWTAFNDPVLSELIERASVSNYELHAAVSRIAESRALRSAVSGQYTPSVDAVGSYRRSRESEAGFFGGFGSLSADQYNLYSAGFDAVWEIDLFGRIGRSVESAQASLQASIEDWRSVQTSLFAEVARNYIELRSAQQRIELALLNTKLQQQTLELTQGRYKVELVSKADVAQAQLNLANTESEIPLLRIAESAAFNRLVVLTGGIPAEMETQLLQAGQMPQSPAQITAGIPIELLRRRPDIRRAERLLAAQTAQIGVATSNLYPAFSLTGSFALTGTEFSDLGDLSSRAYSFGPGLRWNLFNGNQYRSLVLAEEARASQLWAAYESAVLQAVEEVENAMVGLVQQNARQTALERSVAAAQESVELLNALYSNGLTDFENVLVTQRALSVQQDRLAVTESQVLQQAVALYKALGGGWDYACASAESQENMMD